MSTRFGGPNWSELGYYHDYSNSNLHTTPHYPPTITNLGGTSSTDRRRTGTPATYVHDYELEIARWQARNRSRSGPCRLTCSVCLDVMDPSIWIRPTALCRHEPKICKPCLSQYVEHAIRVEGLTEVLCPDVGCRHQMDREDVVGYIRGDPECLNRYNALVAQRALESHPNFFWCQNPQCSRGQIHIGGVASPLVICRYCYAYSCFVHQMPWHDGLTCEEYTMAIHQRGIQASEEYIGRHAKRCPQCRRPIEKITGCDHMTCRRPGGCGHEFCWECLADYGPIHSYGNYRHNPGCRHHPNDQVTAFEVPLFDEIELLRPTVRETSRRPLRSRTLYSQIERPPTPVALGGVDDWDDLTAQGWGRRTLGRRGRRAEVERPPTPVDTRGTGAWGQSVW